MARKLPAILFLLVFTPVFAEAIASTNTPWFAFFNPKVLIFMVLLYGTAALGLRELMVRGKVGFGHFLLYGAIFAGLNEGIVAATWFKPNPLNFSGAELARAGGTNWHMVVNLIMYHTLFSMLIPIVLSFIIFPRLKNTPLLTQRGMIVCAGLLLLVGVASLLPNHQAAVADAARRLALLLVLIAATAIGLKTGRRPQHHQPAKDFTPKNLLLFGIGFTVLFGLSYFVLPRLLPGRSLWFSLTLYIGSILLAHRIGRSIDNNFSRLLPLIGGLLLPSFVLSFAQIRIGQPVIIGAFLVYVWWLYKKSQSPHRLITSRP